MAFNANCKLLTRFMQHKYHPRTYFYASSRWNFSQTKNKLNEPSSHFHFGTHINNFNSLALSSYVPHKADSQTNHTKQQQMERTCRWLSLSCIPNKPNSFFPACVEDILWALPHGPFSANYCRSAELRTEVTRF